MSDDMQHTKDSPESRFRAIVLYDGLCVLCNWFVRWVLRADKDGLIGFAPLDSELAANVRDTIPIEADSVVLLDGSTVRVKADAVFRILELTGSAWKVFLAFRVLPMSLTNGMYAWIARHRTAWFGRYDSCPAPDTRHRNRFLR